MRTRLALDLLQILSNPLRASSVLENGGLLYSTTEMFLSSTCWTRAVQHVAMPLGAGRRSCSSVLVRSSPMCTGGFRFQWRIVRFKAWELDSRVACLRRSAYPTVWGPPLPSHKPAKPHITSAQLRTHKKKPIHSSINNRFGPPYQVAIYTVLPFRSKRNQNKSLS
ncbi:hypothetical protein BU16DRAFT_70787 [Lophium mytilinum]|uniref:Uncharacterized protein n=1 Tax=Lophium mytilinum TaxID=390894 RepID=A0A6A6QP64_9PEZI|nr:hypothetical protein BU16DRAFT_70787 [Lophium mytilinum]